MTTLRTLPSEVRAAMANLPLPLRAGISCALVCGVLGGLCGLVLGLIAYPPTAWFAVLEVGVPATFVGGIVGLAIGGLLSLARRARLTV
jgi:hypothetical protein